MALNKRDFLKGSSALALGALASPALVGRAAAADPIRLGSVLDVSGIFDGYGRPMDMALRLAVAEINESGGLLDRPVEITGYDTQSDIALYTQYAQQLARRDRVDVVHGGILSASREAIRPILRRAEIPYFYNVLYEGGVCDRNVVVTGVTPAQQVAVLVPAAIERWGRRIYILAADYNYGQNTARWMRKFAEEAGGEVVETDFFPLDVSDFGSTIAKIQTAAPDIVLSALVGGAHLSFYRQWAAAGMKDRIPMASTTLGVGNEHRILGPEADGILVAYNYAPEIDSPTNRAFLGAWAEAYGDTGLVNELAVSNYQGVKLWAEAVRRAGTVARMPLIEAIESGMSIEGPGGTVVIDPKTHHAVLDVHLMEFRDGGAVILETFEQRPPIDTQSVCDLEANPDDVTQYEIEI
ncbi:urea ABC transporter substrate-binding protein [Salinarimonas sp. NSM]|uniref:urea ABC transporter substrate-binding protein n=1 Tax=Salinarimonas sp. NSM TaxID=3458003 RepID=UPI0040357005